MLVVNLDYTKDISTTIVDPGPMEIFDAGERRWHSTPDGAERVEVDLRAGGGKLLRLR